MKNDIYMTTGEFARMMRISKDTLFHYDKIGLLKPEKVKANGYRYYSVYQADLLEMIFVLRDLGMPLKEIQTHLEDRDPERIEQLFAEREVQIEEEIRKLNRMKGWIRKNRRRIRDTLQIDTESIAIRSLPERYYLYSETKEGSERDLYVKSSQMIQQLIEAEPEAIYDFAAVQWEQNIEAGIYDAYDNTMVLMDERPADIPCRVLESGEFLVGYHKGAWQEVGEAYERMLDYSREHGIVLSGQFVERYVVDGFTTMAEAEYVTELSVRILKKRQDAAG